MLKWAIIFGILSLIAGGLGFTGAAGTFGTIAKILFGIFLVVCAIFIALAFFIIS